MGDVRNNLGGHPSEVDWPGSFFWRELMDVYPDAKILLSVRDAESWNDTEAFKQGIIGGAVTSVQQRWDREQAAVA